MKLTAVHLKDEAGNTYTWKIERVPRAVSVILGHKNRVMSGWQFTDHDDYPRFVEGNWKDLVYHFQSTAENYGLQLMSKLN